MIWETQFNPETKQCTGSSVPTRFNTVDEVVAARDDEVLKQAKSYVVYEGVIYSMLKWHVAEEVSFL